MKQQTTNSGRRITINQMKQSRKNYGENRRKNQGIVVRTKQIE